MTLALMQSMGKLKFLHCLLPLPFRDVPFPLRASKLRDFNAINKFVPLRDVSGSCEVLILYINIECLHTPKEDASGSGTATACSAVLTSYFNTPKEAVGRQLPLTSRKGTSTKIHMPRQLAGRPLRANKF
jgi:hypothetical protein